MRRKWFRLYNFVFLLYISCCVCFSNFPPHRKWLCLFSRKKDGKMNKQIVECIESMRVQLITLNHQNINCCKMFFFYVNVRKDSTHSTLFRILCVFMVYVWPRCSCTTSLFPHTECEMSGTENITCEKRDWYNARLQCIFIRLFLLPRARLCVCLCFDISEWAPFVIDVVLVVRLVGFVWSENGFGIGVITITEITFHWFPIARQCWCRCDHQIGIFMDSVPMNMCVLDLAKVYVYFCFVSNRWIARARGKWRDEYYIVYWKCTQV